MVSADCILKNVQQTLLKLEGSFPAKVINKFPRHLFFLSQNCSFFSFSGRPPSDDVVVDRVPDGFRVGGAGDAEPDGRHRRRRQADPLALLLHPQPRGARHEAPKVLLLRRSDRLRPRRVLRLHLRRQPDRLRRGGGQLRVRLPRLQRQAHGVQDTLHQEGSREKVCTHSLSILPSSSAGVIRSAPFTSEGIGLVAIEKLILASP